MVRTSERTWEIAARQGLPTAVVNQFAASYWLETGGSSPVSGDAMSQDSTARY